MSYGKKLIKNMQVIDIINKKATLNVAFFYFNNNFNSFKYSEN
jgi:hypothetical protein